MWVCVRIRHFRFPDIQTHLPTTHPRDAPSPVHLRVHGEEEERRRSVHAHPVQKTGTPIESSRDLYHHSWPRRMFIDATEFRIESPTANQNHKLVFSQYKGGTTVKVILALTASGDIAFVSNAYPGAAPDDFVVRDSGLLDVFGPGCVYVADKGFTDFVSYVDKGCQLITPPKAFQKQPRMSVDQSRSQFDICSKRVHVERVFGAIKGTWRVLKASIPISRLDMFDVMLRVCAHLTSLTRPPFVAFANTLAELDEEENEEQD